MDAPDRHNGQIEKETGKLTNVSLSKFVCLCLRWSLTLSRNKDRKSSGLHASWATKFIHNLTLTLSHI